MNYFGLTAYDPLDGSTTSIDPLNSLAFSVNLADLVFPGSSGRIWKIRYLSTLCFLIDCSSEDEDSSFKENYLDFRRYENVMILACTLLKNEKDVPGLSGLMGTAKASRLIENSSRGYVDISGEILSNQMNLGPLGVHQVLLRSLGLIEENNLILTNRGKELAQLYRANLGDTAKVIQELGAKNKVDTEKLKNALVPLKFSFNLSDKQNEAEIIFKLLIDNPQRSQLLKDINSFRIPDPKDLDDEYVSHMLAAQKSSNHVYYNLIYHYEMFQRKLHVFFNHFLQSPIPKKLETFDVAKKYLLTIQGSLIEHGSNFKKLCYSLPSQESKTFQTFINLVDDLLPRLNSFEDFTTFLLIDLHGKHQANKNKASWVHFENGMIAAKAVNLRGENDLQESRLHRYRYANVDIILSELGRQDYK